MSGCSKGEQHTGPVVYINWDFLFVLAMALSGGSFFCPTLCTESDEDTRKQWITKDGKNCNIIIKGIFAVKSKEKPPKQALRESKIAIIADEVCGQQISVG